MSDDGPITFEWDEEEEDYGPITFEWDKEEEEKPNYEEPGAFDGPEYDAPAWYTRKKIEENASWKAPREHFYELNKIDPDEIDEPITFEWNEDEKDKPISAGEDWEPGGIYEPTKKKGKRQGKSSLGDFLAERATGAPFMALGGPVGPSIGRLGLYGASRMMKQAGRLFDSDKLKKAGHYLDEDTYLEALARASVGEKVDISPPRELSEEEIAELGYTDPDAARQAKRAKRSIIGNVGEDFAELKQAVTAIPSLALNLPARSAKAAMDEYAKSSSVPKAYWEGGRPARDILTGVGGHIVKGAARYAHDPLDFTLDNPLEGLTMPAMGAAVGARGASAMRGTGFFGSEAKAASRAAQESVRVLPLFDEAIKTGLGKTGPTTAVGQHLYDMDIGIPEVKAKAAAEQAELLAREAARGQSELPPGAVKWTTDKAGNTQEEVAAKYKDNLIAQQKERIEVQDEWAKKEADDIEAAYGKDNFVDEAPLEIPENPPIEMEAQKALPIEDRVAQLEEKLTQLTEKPEAPRKYPRPTKEEGEYELATQKQYKDYAERAGKQEALDKDFKAAEAKHEAELDEYQLAEATRKTRIKQRGENLEKGLKEEKEARMTEMQLEVSKMKNLSKQEKARLGGLLANIKVKDSNLRITPARWQLQDDLEAIHKSPKLLKQIADPKNKWTKELVEHKLKTPEGVDSMRKMFLKDVKITNNLAQEIESAAKHTDIKWTYKGDDMDSIRFQASPITPEDFDVGNISYRIPKGSNATPADAEKLIGMRRVMAEVSRQAAMIEVSPGKTLESYKAWKSNVMDYFPDVAIPSIREALGIKPGNMTPVFKAPPEQTIDARFPRSTAKKFSEKQKSEYDPNMDFGYFQYAELKHEMPYAQRQAWGNIAPLHLFDVAVDLAMSAQLETLRQAQLVDFIANPHKLHLDDLSPAKAPTRPQRTVLPEVDELPPRPPRPSVEEPTAPAVREIPRKEKKTGAAAPEGPKYGTRKEEPGEYKPWEEDLDVAEMKGAETLKRKEPQEGPPGKADPEPSTSKKQDDYSSEKQDKYIEYLARKAGIQESWKDDVSLIRWLEENYGEHAHIQLLTKKQASTVISDLEGIIEGRTPPKRKFPKRHIEEEDWVKEAVEGPKAKQKPSIPATEKQVAYLEQLFRQTGMRNEEAISLITKDRYGTKWTPGKSTIQQLSAGEADALIRELVQERKLHRGTQAQQVHPLGIKNFPAPGLVRIPDAKAPGTDMPLWGPLAGKYAPKPIYRKLKMYTKYRSDWYQRVARFIGNWKRFKLHWNPGSHLHALAGGGYNQIFHGGSPKDMGPAAKELLDLNKSKEHVSPTLRAAIEDGVITQTTSKMGGDLVDIPANFKAQDYDSWLLRVVGGIADAGGEAYASAAGKNVLAHKLQYLWQINENSSKLAVYKRSLERFAESRGKTLHWAIRTEDARHAAKIEVDRIHFDYENMPGLITHADRLGVAPFSRYTWKMGGLMLTLSEKQPMLMQGIRALDRTEFDLGDRETKERLSIQPSFKDSMAKPLDDLTGRPTDFNWRYISPFIKPGEAVGYTATGSYGVDLYDESSLRKTAKQAGGPLKLPLELLFSENFNFEKPLNNPIAHAIYSIGPGATYHLFQKIIPALKGEKDARGRTRSAPQAIANALGIRVADPEIERFKQDIVKGYGKYVKRVNTKYREERKTDPRGAKQRKEKRLKQARARRAQLLGAKP